MFLKRPPGKTVSILRQEPAILVATIKSHYHYYVIIGTTLTQHLSLMCIMQYVVMLAEIQNCFLMGPWDPQDMIVMSPRALRMGPITVVFINWKF